MAEFWRALRTLKALQAEQAADTELRLQVQLNRPAAPPPLVHRPQPDEPERRLEYAFPEPPAPGRTLHEPAAPWLPNEPEPRQRAASAPVRRDLVPNEPEAHRARGFDHAKTTPPPGPAPARNARHGFPGSHGPSQQMPSPWLRIR